jgi:hypothetical protein
MSSSSLRVQSGFVEEISSFIGLVALSYKFIGFVYYFGIDGFIVEVWA